MKKFQFKIGQFQWNILCGLSEFKTGGTIMQLREYLKDNSIYWLYYKGLRSLHQQGLVERIDKSHYKLSDIGNRYIAYVLAKMLKGELGKNVK